MKAIPFKNRKLGAGMSFYAAVCFAGSAVFFAKSATPILSLALLTMSVLYIFVGIVILRKWKQR
jgi:hypothetical protein